MSEKMTIAQALRRIKKLKGLIAESKQRAEKGVSYDVSKVPAFRFKEAYESMLQYQQEMLALQAKVAVANSQGTVKFNDQDVVLAKAVRVLEELKGHISFLKDLNLRNELVKERQVEWDDNEMKNLTRVVETTFKSDLSEQDRDSLIKKLQNEFEVLNNAVENANHVFFI